MRQNVHHQPDTWIDHIFSAKAVEKGGVIRRATAWVDHEVGRTRFLDEVRRRGFHLFEGGGQFIVICNSHPVRRLLCPADRIFDENSKSQYASTTNARPD